MGRLAGLVIFIAGVFAGMCSIDLVFDASGREGKHESAHFYYQTVLQSAVVILEIPLLSGIAMVSLVLLIVRSRSSAASISVILLSAALAYFSVFVAPSQKALADLPQVSAETMESASHNINIIFYGHVVLLATFVLVALLLSGFASPVVLSTTELENANKKTNKKKNA